MRFSMEWLETHQKKVKSRRTKKQSADANWLSSVVPLTPHAIALAALAKDPTLLKGNQEHYDQVRVFDQVHRKHPELYDYLHATPNGGYRTPKAAASMPAEGQKKGYPDMSLDKPAGVYHGMRIEQKQGAKKPTTEQVQWLNRLADQGYYCVLAFTPEEAVQALLNYSRLKPGEAMSPHDNERYWRKTVTLTD